jgi:PTH1 family peptidyl-tRNA hydrolase
MQEKFNPQKIKLIIGLGNPTAKYAATYHNVGHQFIDYLRNNLQMPKEKILKSGSFMNESGRYIAELIKKWHLAKPEEILIVHDDSDLALGNYKLSFGRGSAGHRGVESIIKSLGTKNFWRLRIGIRSPKEKIRRRAEEFVLKKISPTDKKIITETFAAAVKIFLGNEHKVEIK